MDPSHDDPPWSIPIREAGPDIPQRAATWTDRVPVAPFVIGALALFAALVLAMPGLDGDRSDPEPEVLGAGVRSDMSVDGSVDTTRPSTSSAPSTTASTTTAPTTTTGSSQAPAPDEPARERSATGATDPEPAGLPIHTPGDLGGGWVAQVSSVPSSAGGAALSRSYDTVRRAVPDAMIVRGSEWASLRDGFWVIFHPGYDDAPAAVAACEAWGFDGKDECFARYLSVDDGTQRTCWRDESGSLAGTCS